MKIKYFFLLLALLNLLPFLENVQAQSVDTQWDSLTAEQVLSEAELALIRLEFKEAEFDLKSQFNWIIILFVTILGVTLSTAIPLLINTQKRIRQKVEEVTREKISKVLKEESDLVANLLAKHSLEARLKESKTVQVISLMGADDSLLRTMCMEENFRKFQFSEAPEYRKPPKADLLLLNYWDLPPLDPEEKKVLTETLKSYVTNADRKTQVLLHGSIRVNPDDFPKDRKDQFGFANSPYTVYPNLMDFLRYHHTVNNK